jgi:hypothetical protein
VTFIIAMIAGELVARNTEKFAYARNGPRLSELPDGDWFLDHSFDVVSLSHYVFYYGIGQAMTNARNADILIVGNSMANFAFPSQVTDGFARKHDIKFFSISLGAETKSFEELLITKHDLRPKIVIVNADKSFFAGKMSDGGKGTMKESSWEYLKGEVENRGKYGYVRYLRRFFPQFLPKIPPPYELNEEWGFTIYRSALHGAWRFWCNKDLKIPVISDSTANVLAPEQLEIARRFKEFVEARGGNLIFTLAPSAYPNVSRRRAAELAARLEVPFIAPELEGLVTLDGAHLNEESGARFAAAFLDQLESEPVFTNILLSRSP